MISVFMRTSEYEKPLRNSMAFLCAERWQIESDVKFFPIVDQGIVEARIYAEEHAESDPYIFTDDDVLILGKNWVKRGVDAMLSCPEYGICSTLSLVEGENAATGQGVIYPMHAVGQPMFIRTGVCTEFPPDFNFTYECQILQGMCEAKGRKMGIINGLRHNHIGHGFSGSKIHFWGY